jgi:hypothetical protein
MAQQLICSACGHVGSSKTAIKGSGWIELILLLCFIIPGIIYSVWRSSSRHKTCPSCGSTNLIPLNSPIGRKLLADQGKTPEAIQAEIEASKTPVGKKILKGVVIFVAVCLILIVLIIIYAS